VHNLFGYEILNATYQALTQTIQAKRPFIIGRSTFSGAGQYAGHWGGDNYATWESMLFSIPQALDFSLFGMPMFGADTCGFSGNSDEELCNRWMQLSAFFTFYRNHNTLGDNSQEPYIWGSVIDASKKAMAIRYSLLPYMYTLFHAAHETGSTVMRAMAWEFPNDPSLADANRQFMLGPSLLITPVLESQLTSVNGVFPGSKSGTTGTIKLPSLPPLAPTSPWTHLSVTSTSTSAAAASCLNKRPVLPPLLAETALGVSSLLSQPKAPLLAVCTSMTARASSRMRLCSSTSPPRSSACTPRLVVCGRRRTLLPTSLFWVFRLHLRTSRLTARL
jgi:hypothetical protein